MMKLSLWQINDRSAHCGRAGGVARSVLLAFAFVLVFVIGRNGHTFDCGARCVFTEALSWKQSEQAPAVPYDLIQPAMSELDHCYRIWITDDLDEPDLVDESQYEVWQYRKSDGGITCEPNSAIMGVALVGENQEGDPANITCYSECDEQID